MGGYERRVSPGEQIDELGFGHAVGQDAGDGSHAGPEQIDLGLPLPAVSGRKMKMDARATPRQEQNKKDTHKD